MTHIPAESETCGTCRWAKSLDDRDFPDDKERIDCTRILTLNTLLRHSHPFAFLLTERMNPVRLKTSLCHFDPSQYSALELLKESTSEIAPTRFQRMQGIFDFFVTHPRHNR